MNNEFRLKYISITIITRLVTLIMVILINILMILWIENQLSLERSIILSFFIFSLILEIIGVLLVMFSLILLVKLQGINRYYRVAIMIPISIEFIVYIYYLVRFFGFLCFAPGILLINIPFILLSLICLLILQKNQKYFISRDG